MACGWGARTVRPILTAHPLAVRPVFLLFAMVVTLAMLIPELDSPLVSQLTQAFRPNDKINLFPYRVLHLLALALLGREVYPVRLVGSWLAGQCGQQSLEVFCVGVFLSFVAHFVLETTSNAFFVKILVGAARLSIMTGVAYYRSWSKKIDRLAIATPQRPLPPLGAAAPFSARSRLQKPRAGMLTSNSSSAWRPEPSRGIRSIGLPQSWRSSGLQSS